jgi:hypothetical protein
VANSSYPILGILTTGDQAMRKSDERMAVAAFKHAMKLGEEADHAAAQLKQFAELFVKTPGAPIQGMLPYGVTVDDQGDAYVPGYQSWSSGAMQLRILANAIVGMAWHGEDLASLCPRSAKNSGTSLLPPCVTSSYASSRTKT